MSSSDSISNLKDVVMLNKLRTRLRALLRKSEMERDLDEELRYHIERQTEQNIRLGMNPEEARNEARKAFGGVEQAKERSRDVRGVRWLEDLWQDTHYGARTLAKSPGFTLVAVITLALGIGAVAAIFSVVMAVLARPLAYREAERLVWLSNRNSSLGVNQTFLNPGDILDLQEQAKSLEQVASWATLAVNISDSGVGAPERLETIYATTNFFQTLGAQPLLGREFTPADGETTGAAVIISYGVWQRRFGGDPGVIGQKIKLGLPRDMMQAVGVVIGVMPPEFQFPP